MTEASQELHCWASHLPIVPSQLPQGTTRYMHRISCDQIKSNWNSFFSSFDNTTFLKKQAEHRRIPVIFVVIWTRKFTQTVKFSDNPPNFPYKRLHRSNGGRREAYLITHSSTANTRLLCHTPHNVEPD